jgi:UDP-glucose 4-epimerase
MRYLVTGGAGFIGSHLVDELVARGNDVLVIDNLSMGAKYNLNPKARFMGFDCGDIGKLTGFLGDVPVFDGVFHLASSVGVRGICADPGGTSRNIICAADAITRWRRGHASKPRLVMASSSEVYGNKGGLLREDAPVGEYPMSGGRWAYAAAKRITESMDSEAIIARLFNCAGIRQREDAGMVVPSFIGRAIRGEPLIVHDMDHYRSFCAVADTVAGLITLMEAGVPGEIYNVGNDSPETGAYIMDLARAIVAEAESGSEVIVQSPDYPGWSPILERHPSAAKLRALGWQPQQNDIGSIISPVVAHAVEALALLA